MAQVGARTATRTLPRRISDLGVELVKDCRRTFDDRAGPQGLAVQEPGLGRESPVQAGWPGLPGLGPHDAPSSWTTPTLDWRTEERARLAISLVTVAAWHRPICRCSTRMPSSGPSKRAGGASSGASPTSPGTSPPTRGSRARPTRGPSRWGATWASPRAPSCTGARSVSSSSSRRPRPPSSPPRWSWCRPRSTSTTSWTWRRAGAWSSTPSSRGSPCSPSAGAIRPPSTGTGPSTPTSERWRMRCGRPARSPEASRPTPSRSAPAGSPPPRCSATWPRPASP